ncbi:hypothetical protein FNH09_04385 [Streptomyces adustus]|uniref:Uncharacterized protein n=1 Tax=Streptomyces adustus TaxID=1609272 RepID=A0A5N8V5W1_9ACTN|nr:hypothetical protein [Streptomyces adustus]MPY30573.1 hypothetical protein [Streptomyces adustus]
MNGCSWPTVTALRVGPGPAVLYQQGRLPLEKFVTERIGLDDVEDAFHTMHTGPPNSVSGWTHRSDCTPVTASCGR